MEEIWKDIPGYDGYYQVSNLGRIKSLPRCKPTDKRKSHNNIRKPKLAANGYFKINLSKDSKVKWYGLHRLVAMAFIPNPKNFPVVNHKDENPQNNCVDNLEWCTVQYNCNYGTARERQKKTRAANPNDRAVRKMVGERNSRAVRAYSPSGEFIGEYKSLTDASKQLRVNISQISRHCNGHVGNDKNRPIRK